MEQNILNEWQKASDQAELYPLTQNLPKDAPKGSVFEEFGDQPRKWIRLEILHGNNGARWAYWTPWLNDEGRYGVGPNPNHQAIADNIFNGDAAHFVGMLGIPYVKLPGESSLMWVLIEPKMSEPPKPIHLEEKPKERYERSKEVYDVQTRTSRKLP